MPQAKKSREIRVWVMHNGAPLETSGTLVHDRKAHDTNPLVYVPVVGEVRALGYGVYESAAHLKYMEMRGVRERYEAARRALELLEALPEPGAQAA